MTVKEFSEKYNLTEKTVQKYCKQGKIDGAKKMSGIWRIPNDSIKPLSDKQIRLMLISILLFKNDTTAKPDFSLGDCKEEDIPRYFKYLSNREYILGFDINDGDRIPFNSFVSKKGISFLLAGKDQSKILNLMIKYSPTIVEILLVIAKYYIT